MSDAKITALSADTSPTTDDLIVTVNDPGGTPANKKVTLSAVKTLVNTSPSVTGWDGWQADTNTWTYSSVDEHTSVLTVNADVTGYIGLFDRIKLTNNSLTQYFMVSKISYSNPNTTITMYGGAVPVYLGATTYTNGGGARTTIAVTALSYAIPNGATIRFPNGDTTTLSSGAAVGDTTLNIASKTPATTNGGWLAKTGAMCSNYVLANSAITNPFYSHDKRPHGFNPDPALWTDFMADVTNPTQTNPAVGTWYNTNALQLAVPIGVWDLKLTAHAYSNTFTNTTLCGPIMTLSTANNSESDYRMSVAEAFVGPTGTYQVVVPGDRFKQVLLTSKTSFYLNIGSVYAVPHASAFIGLIGGASAGMSQIIAVFAGL